MKEPFWALCVAPEEFNNNRNTFLVCIARMWIHYLESISIVWCHSNFLLFSADYLALCGGRKKTTLLAEVITLQSNCAIWLGLPESLVHSQCIETVIPEEPSIVYHSSQYQPLIEVKALKKLQNLKNKHTSRGMKWKARAKKNSMKEKNVIEEGEEQSKGRTHPK